MSNKIIRSANTSFEKGRCSDALIKADFSEIEKRFTALLIATKDSRLQGSKESKDAGKRKSLPRRIMEYSM